LVAKYDGILGLESQEISVGNQYSWTEISLVVKTKYFVEKSAVYRFTTIEHS
jgi:hypothetical protein